MCVGDNVNGPNVEGFCVDPDVHLAPLATIGRAVLAWLPAAFIHHFDAGGVSQQMHTVRTGATAKRHQQRFLTPTQRRIIWQWQVHHQTRRLLQRQVELRFQRQAQLDCAVRNNEPLLLDNRMLPTKALSMPRSNRESMDFRLTTVT